MSLAMERMGRCLIGLVLLFAGSATVLPAQELPADPTALQRQIVAQLSGWSEEDGQIVPFSRSTPAERAAASSYLADTLVELKLEPRRHDYRFRNVNPLVDLLLPPYRGTNVYTEVVATVPSSEYVVLGAHYDSERHSPGAVDNASGVALVMAVARAVARLETRSRNFFFVFFDQEEDDEVGSRAFARFLLDRDYDVHSVHVTDLAAWDEDGDGAVEIQSPAPHLEPLYREAAAALSIPLEVIGGGASDNRSFMEAGLPAIGVFQADMTPHLHRPTDTYETADFAFLASMTRLVSTVMEGLAQP